MLSSPLSSIRRISPLYQKRLKKLGLETVRDLIYHFPYRYDDFSKIIPIKEVKIGQTQTIQGKIIEINNTRTWRKKMVLTEAIIEDASSAIKVVWFNQPYLIKSLKKGDVVNLAGKIQYDGSNIYFSSPIYEKIKVSDNISDNRKLAHTGRLVPVYPETEGLSSRWLRFILKLILPRTISEFKDFLPQEMIENQQLMRLQEALGQIHFPDSEALAQRAKKRLAFDELFLIQLYSFQQRQKWQEQQSFRIKFNQPLIKDFVEHLPFKLTNAQRKAAWEILQDLEKPQPMNRLLEGDVGSGKTVVASIAALQVVKDGGQVALMAPTEVLAEQHFQTITGLFKKSSIKIGLLTGSKACLAPSLFRHPTSHRPRMSSVAQKREQILQEIEQGKIDLIIGTHALIQEKVSFKNLALAIIDEQHRFGIRQRAALQKEVKLIPDESPKIIPHLLSMTATPIPRSLALTVWGDLDLSLLDEMPQGRKKIMTKIVNPDDRKKAYSFIRQQIKNGRQAFVICPRIENPSSDVNGLTQPVSSAVKGQTINETGSDKRLTNYGKRYLSWAEVKAVKEEYKKLKEKVFPDLRIAMLHGKMSAKEKQKIMKDFSAYSPRFAGEAGGPKNKKIDILVSTSVVEVGVDIPNATVMMIEGADRFGLAQLHQFRGRVGRSEHQSYCFLFTESTARSSHQRLRALQKCDDGFVLAEMDLALRGPGEFFGTRQWGLPDLSMASLSDVKLIKAARQAAQELIKKDHQLKKYPLLREKMKEFGEKVHLE